MANTIRIKRSTTAASPSSLSAGELAYSQNSQKLWIGRPNDGGAVLAIGGELYVNMLDHTAGTLTASSAIVVDGNSKVNQLKTTNLTIGANAITSGSGDVDIVAAANLDIDAGTIDLSTQATEVSIIDNSTTALVFKEASNAYLTLSTANGVERVTITPATTITGALTLSSTVAVGNYLISGSTISSTNSNGHINLTPNGTGNVIANTDTLTVSGAEDGRVELTLLAGEAAAAQIRFQADEGDDDGDVWTITAGVDDTLKIFTDKSGSDVAALTITNNATIASGTTAIATGLTVAGSATLESLTVNDVAVDGKVITMTGSASDTAVFTAGTNGTLSIVTTDASAAAANIQITADGTVDIDSAGVLTLDSGAGINLEPAAGSAILLDGTISVDAGVVTGATSITSTAFVGTLSTAAQPNITSLGTIASLVATTADINNGTVEAVIGGTTPKAGTFTTITANTSITGTLATVAQPNITSLGTIASLVATTADINAGTVDAVVGGTTPAAGTFTIAKANTSVQTPLIEFTDGDDAITIVDGGGVTIASLTSPSVDINGGAIDGTIIGANSAAAITGTTINGTIATATTSVRTPLIEFTDGDDAITIADGGGVTIPNLTATTADINAGTVDAVIGGSTPASGTFTTLTANTSITGTLATAAQTNVTSLGTLTSLTVDTITINAADIAGSGAISLTPTGTNTVTVPAGYKDRSGYGNNSLATKEYVDAISNGLDVKDSVRVATTANGTLSSAFANSQTVDGVTLATNDRILLKNQSTGSQNGIYTVNASGAPTRATDYDADVEVTGGAFVFVEEGTTNADSGWILTNNGSITVGSTALTYAQFSGAGQITAGDAMSKSGNTLNVNDDNITLEVASDTLRIKAVTATAVGDILYGKASNAGYSVLAKPGADSSFLTMGTAGTAAWTATIDGGTFS